VRINPLTSKTILGVLFAVVSWLLSPEVTATIHNVFVAAVLQGIGMLWATYGVRDAIAKASQGQAQ